VTNSQINFNDGDGYEATMGVFSQQAAAQFLPWLKAPEGSKWLDVGAGNGAFAASVIKLCSPIKLEGIDPSESQIQFAQQRPDCEMANFQTGSAMELPYGDNVFDVAAMALVLFFVPEPAGAIAEMQRVVKKGGIVSAYTWDILNGGAPWNTLQQALCDMGYQQNFPPSSEASKIEVGSKLWVDAGLSEVCVDVFEIEQMFNSVDEAFDAGRQLPTMKETIDDLSDDDLSDLKQRVRKVWDPHDKGSFTIQGRANAVMGIV